MKLRSAVVCSAAFHFGLMALQPPQGLVPPRQALQSIEVTLMPGDGPIPARPRPRPVPQTVRPAPSPLMPAASAVSAEPEPVRPALADAPPRAPAQRPRPVPLKPPPSEAPRPAPVAQPAAVTPTVSEPAHSILSNLPEREFAVVQHKRLVRQHLKRRLSYPAGWGPGTVHLHLVLRPDGALQESSVSQASDPLLGLTALNGARSAAPYPPFPKEMKEPRADYEFLVQYRQDADAE